MSNSIKNWIIGALVVVVVFLGYKFISGEPQISTQTPTSTQIETSAINPTNISNCIDSTEAWNQIGKNTCVEFYVGSPFRSGKGNVFLNEKRDYKNGFTVWIPSGSVSNFSGNPITMYGYKTIQVTGLIRMYQGHPEIIANSQSQIIVK